MALLNSKRLADGVDAPPLKRRSPPAQLHAPSSAGILTLPQDFFNLLAVDFTLCEWLCLRVCKLLARRVESAVTHVDVGELPPSHVLSTSSPFCLLRRLPGLQRLELNLDCAWKLDTDVGRGLLELTRLRSLTLGDACPADLEFLSMILRCHTCLESLTVHALQHKITPTGPPVTLPESFPPHLRTLELYTPDASVRSAPWLSGYPDAPFLSAGHLSRVTVLGVGPRVLLPDSLVTQTQLLALSMICQNFDDQGLYDGQLLFPMSLPPNLTSLRVHSLLPLPANSLAQLTQLRILHTQHLTSGLLPAPALPPQGLPLLQELTLSLWDNSLWSALHLMTDLRRLSLATRGEAPFDVMEGCLSYLCGGARLQHLRVPDIEYVPDLTRACYVALCNSLLTWHATSLQSLELPEPSSKLTLYMALQTASLLPNLRSLGLHLLDLEDRLYPHS
jgi:hypothetical protein